MKRWLRRQRRRWALWWGGNWRCRWVRCRLCQQRYHRDIWPKPARIPYRDAFGVRVWPYATSRLPCGHSLGEGRTGIGGWCW